jgi:hypothetical protein
MNIIDQVGRSCDPPIPWHNSSRDEVKQNAMSTFFFQTTELKTDSTRVQECMEALQQKGTIQRWQIKAYEGEPVLSVDTVEVSSEALKHLIRECGIDVQFSAPPQAGS